MRRERTFAASARLAFSTSQRGLSGRSRRALIKIAASTPPVPSSNRQSVSVGCARSIAMAVIAARTMPTQLQCNRCNAVMRLRKALRHDLRHIRTAGRKIDTDSDPDQKLASQDRCGVASHCAER